MLDAVTKVTKTGVCCLPRVDLGGQGQSSSGQNIKTIVVYPMDTEDEADL